LRHTSKKHFLKTNQRPRKSYQGQRLKIQRRIMSLGNPKKSQYCVGIPELFSLNWREDPCIQNGKLICDNSKFASKPCPVGVDFFRFPSGELRLDCAYCNLMCIPCWAKQCPHENHFNCYRNGYGSKEEFTPEELVDRILCRAQRVNEYVATEKTFQIRFTGGEPIVSRKRWNHIVETLTILDRRLNSEECDYAESLDDRLHDYGPRGREKRKRVVIQTNGVFLERIISSNDLIDTIENFERISILVHHSIKGSNPHEFHRLTRSNKSLFHAQVELIDKLVDVSESVDNFDFHVVFGFFHSNRYLLWNPFKNQPMLIEPDSRFLRKVEENQNRTYVEPLDFRPRMVLNAGTIDRCIEKGIIQRKDDVENKLIAQLEPLPQAGQKTKISKTFWNNLF
jgi:uncharacterized Fe-S cluster-containing radical SAM superfamily protein